MDLNKTFAARFWSKVKKTDGCWEWQAHLNESGYGQIGANGRKGSMVAAHRASWVLHHGSIPVGAHVLHKCDNPACVRPSHLELGDQSLNMQHKRARNRCSSRVVFTKQEVHLLREAYASGMTKAELGRRTRMDYGTLARILNSDYKGRDPITLDDL